MRHLKTPILVSALLASVAACAPVQQIVVQQVGMLPGMPIPAEVGGQPQSRTLVMAMGEEQPLVSNLTADPSDYLWLTSDASVLAVDIPKQKVTALQTGIGTLTLIRQSNQMLIATVQVTVVEKRLVANIQVLPSRPVMQLGEKLAFKAEVQMANGSFNSNVTWTSADNTVVTINSTTGEVSALKEGKVSIFAAYTADPRYKGQAEVLVVRDRSQLPTSPSPEAFVFAPPTSLLPTSTANSAIPTTQATPTSLSSGAATSGPAHTSTPKMGITTYNVGSDPRGIAIDSSGNVWVAKMSSDAVTKLSGQGTNLGDYVVGDGPIDLAVDSSGNVWVANNRSNTVTKLSANGTKLGDYTVGNGPLGIAIDSSDNVWVANSGSDTVTKLNGQGANLGDYIVGDAPFDLAVDSSGNVWVANSRSNTVTKLSANGTKLGDYPVSDGPIGIAIDSSDNVWVAKMNSATVSKLNTSGSNLGDYAVNSRPQGIAIDNASNVWVANGRTNFVSRLSASGAKLGDYAVTSPPHSVAVDNSGNVWVAHHTSGTITKLSASAL